MAMDRLVLREGAPAEERRLLTAKLQWQVDRKRSQMACRTLATQGPPASDDTVAAKELSRCIAWQTEAKAVDKRLQSAARNEGKPMAESKDMRLVAVMKAMISLAATAQPAPVSAAA